MYERVQGIKKLCQEIVVSEVWFSRDMTKIYGGSNGIRTITFPRTARDTSQAAFQKVRSAVLNEGLTVLGASTRNCISFGVFENSGLRKIRLPSTLEVIGESTFCMCAHLRSVEFSEGLRKIDVDAFSRSGLESVIFPASLREVGQGAFYKCQSLGTVRFSEGLEVLGTEEHEFRIETFYGVFEESAVERVELPSTLRRLERDTFRGCRNLRTIRLPERLEQIGDECFRECALESVTIPDGIEEIR